MRRGIGRKPLVVTFTALQCLLTVAFGLVITGGAPSVWLMAALLFGASTFFNAMQPIAQAMIADIADPAHHGAAFGMNNLIGETGAVLVAGGQRRAARRDRRVVGRRLPRRRADRVRRACCSCSCASARTRRCSGAAETPDRESRLGPRIQPSRRTTV